MAAFGSGIKKELWVSYLGERAMRAKAKKALVAHKVAQKKLGQVKKAAERALDASRRKEEAIRLGKKKAAEFEKRRAEVKKRLKRGAGAFTAERRQTRPFRRVSKFWQEQPAAYLVRLDGRKAPLKVSGGTMTEALQMAVVMARKLYPKRKGQPGAVHLDGWNRPFVY